MLALAAVAAAALLIAPFLLIDLDLPRRQRSEDPRGRLVPLAGRRALLILLMWTWRRGTRILFEKTRKTDVPLAELVQHAAEEPAAPGAGTAVFLTSEPGLRALGAAAQPQAQQGAAREERHPDGRTEDTPRVAEDERVRIEPSRDASGGSR